MLSEYQFALILVVTRDVLNYGPLHGIFKSLYPYKNETLMAFC